MRTRIKICGMTREQDIEAAVEIGIDAIGLVFYAHSPRGLTPQRANTLIKYLPPFVTTVGLFVDADLAEISTVLEYVPLTCLQFHGNESPERCALARENYHLPIVRAARVTPDLDLCKFADIFIRQAGCSAILLDAWTEQYGGAGKIFDWSLIPAQWLKSDRPRLILSGGLNADNIIHAITQIQPDAVDISSGVETDIKGIKDMARMHAFVNAVHIADTTKDNQSRE